MDGLTNLQTLAFLASCAVAGALILGAVWALAALASLRGLDPEEWDE